jgi:hypothetical protein
MDTTESFFSVHNISSFRLKSEEPLKIGGTGLTPLYQLLQVLFSLALMWKEPDVLRHHIMYIVTE